MAKMTMLACADCGDDADGSNCCPDCGAILCEECSDGHICEPDDNEVE